MWYNMERGILFIFLCWGGVNMKINYRVSGILLLIVALAVVILVVVNIDKDINNNTDVDTEKQLSEEHPTKTNDNDLINVPMEDTEEPQVEDYSPPSGAYYVGEYPSPNEVNSIALWAWHSVPESNFMLDVVIWSKAAEKKQKIGAINLSGVSQINKQELPLWLDDNKALIRGTVFLDITRGELKEMKPDKLKGLIDYQLNNDKTFLALSGTTEDYLGVWVVELITGVEHNVYLLALENFDEHDNYKVAWDLKDNLYFDGINNNLPLIYKYDLVEQKFDLVLVNAKLVDVDMQKNELIYLNYLDGNTHLLNIESHMDNQAYADIMEAAKKHMQRIGFVVGDKSGQIALIKDRVFGNKAIISYGLWSSEIIGEIVLQQEEGKWKVIFDRQRYYLPYYQRLYDAVDFLEQAEGFVFEEMPGKEIVGSPYWDDLIIVLLVGKYGEPWSWEYFLTKKYDEWVILKKQELAADMAQWWQPDSASKSIHSFLENIKTGNYAQAHNILYFDDVDLTLEQFMEGIIFIMGDSKLIDFDLGEIRTDGGAEKATVQVWFIIEKDNQELMVYDRWPCVKIDGSWKIIWSTDLFFNYRNAIEGSTIEGSKI